MKRKLYTENEVVMMIEQGKYLVLSGDERILDKLPKGNWIAGTIPYFMDSEGGINTDDKIFVDEQTNFGEEFKITKYDTSNISSLHTDSFENGFSILIIPSGSEEHIEFSLNSLNYEGIFDNPTIGFISGTDLNKTEQKPSIYNGIIAEKSHEGVIAMHVKLPKNKTARTEIINIFEPSERPDILKFPTTGFLLKDCTVNGEKKNFADYLKEINHDIRFPIIENQSGALINKSFRSVDTEKSEVLLYAPVFEGDEYCLARKLDNYKEIFNKRISNIPETNYACNCILNYLYGEFENHKVNVTGATTFGEIGLQLLNQTLVYLVIE